MRLTAGQAVSGSKNQEGSWSEKHRNSTMLKKESVEFRSRGQLNLSSYYFGPDLPRRYL